MDYQEYKSEFLNEIRANAAVRGADAEDEFIERTFSLLESVDEFQDPIRHDFYKKATLKRNRIMQLTGYCFDEAEKSISLIISDFEDSFEPQTLTNTAIEELYKKMMYFLDECCNGDISYYCDESDETIKIARMIKKRITALQDDLNLILRIKFYIITNKKLSTKIKKLKQSDFEGKPVEINLWHIDRFFELENSFSNEPVSIDLNKDFGFRGIPCLKGLIGENLGYDAYTAIMPGKLLADIYIEYGSKVLEGNVRAFLGTANAKSVNSGIKRTINKDPTKFFTYNNGIAATAAEIELQENNGELLITKISDLQIINGGQTTATLAEAVLKKTNVNLDGIFVPMKLTVIEDRETVDEDGIRFYDDMVQKIARYANSQNKVTTADFFSNSPYHVIMEKMSKKHLAPPVNGNPAPTGWYYERARKKYDQEQMKMSPAEKKLFVTKFPKKQIITKEKLAMHLFAADCKPHVVSRGKNWAIKEFGKYIEDAYKSNKAIFNELYFKKAVASTIIFLTIDTYLEQNKKDPNFWYNVGGYKLNIVPYTISKIINSIPNNYTLDWNKIWQNQSISPAFMREIEIVTKMTNDFICDSKGVIVTEYCKKEETWKNFQAHPYSLSKEFLSELMPIELIAAEEKDAKKDQKETNDLMYVTKIIEFGPEYWTRLLNEGISKNLLRYQEQTLLKQAFEFAKKGQIPLSASGKVPYKTLVFAKSVMEINDKLDAEGIRI